MWNAVQKLLNVGVVPMGVALYCNLIHGSCIISSFSFRSVVSCSPLHQVSRLSSYFLFAPISVTFLLLRNGGLSQPLALEQARLSAGIKPADFLRVYRAEEPGPPGELVRHVPEPQLPTPPASRLVPGLGQAPADQVRRPEPHVRLGGREHPALRHPPPAVRRCLHSAFA